MSSASAASAELRKGWRVIAAALFGITFGVTAVFFYSIGIFLKPIATEFGWSRGAMSTVSIVAGLSLAVTAPLVGAIVDRIGIRRTALMAGVGLTIGFLLLSRAPGSLPAYLGLITLAVLLGSGASPVVYTRLVNQNFEAARGTALGLAQMSTGIAGALVPLFLVPYVAANGWRAGYLALAGVVLVSIPVVVALIGRQGAAVSRSAVAAPAALGQSLAETVRDPLFWRLALVLFLAAVGVGGVIVHMVPMLTDAGLPPARAGATAGLLGLAIIVGRVVTGLIVDRVFAPYVALVVFVVAGAGCLLLGWGGIAAAPVAAVLIGLAMGAEVDLISYFVARYFGMRAYGQIYGWLYAVFMVGSSAGPVLAGAVFDRFGDYAIALTILGASLALAGIAALSLGPFRRFEVAGSA